jgi:hypothetical protein
MSHPELAETAGYAARPIVGLLAFRPGKNPNASPALPELGVVSVQVGRRGEVGVLVVGTV